MGDSNQDPPCSPLALTVVPGSSNRQKLCCPICTRQFSRAEHLSRHVRSHTKEKPFICSDCGKQYSRVDVLVRHRRNAPNHSSSSVGKENARYLKKGRQALTGPADHDEQRGGSGGSREENGEAATMPLQQVPPPILQPNQAHSFTTELDVPGNAETLVGSVDGQDSGSFGFGVNELDWNERSTMYESVGLGLNQLLPDWEVDETLYASLFDLPEVPDAPDDHVSRTQSLRDQKHAEVVKDLWFTRSPATTVNTVPEFPSECTSGITSPQPASSELNDHDRIRLQKRLEIRFLETPVPSADFLNTCIRLYFSRAHSAFPVVHPATFRPSKTRAAVTLAVCVMGTLHTGSEQALAVGVRLFERLQKATLLYWEKAKLDDPSELTAIIQGAVLAQVFSHLSGIPNLLMAADAFHGPPISWARHQDLFGVRHSVNIKIDSTEEELQQEWRAWARNEEYARISHALSIVDAELATLLHHEPIMRLNCRKLTPTSSAKLFMASKASDWRAQWFSERQNWPIYRGEGLAAPSVMSLDISKIPQTSGFTAYAVLEELRMRILGINADKYETAILLGPIRAQLQIFARRYLSRPSSDESDSHSLRILWHSTFISIYTDLDLLEKRVGREGPNVTLEETAQVSDWANSDNAVAAVTHALLIKKKVESQTILHEPAIHVPRSLFNAGVVLFCYGKFASMQRKENLALPQEHLSEIKLLGENVNLLLREACETTPGVPIFQRSLYVIVQLLQRVGSWGLSRSFATILGTMAVQESSDS